MRTILLLVCVSAAVQAHDAHGRSTAPPEARLLKSPLARSDEQAAAGQPLYQGFCAGCHGADGKGRTAVAAKLLFRPTNLTEYLMESMADGEIYWVMSYGIPPSMPVFGAQLSETQRWQIVQYVRTLRDRQRAIEKAKLGPYEWNLPPGFPFPNVPPDNPMTRRRSSSAATFSTTSGFRSTRRNPAPPVISRRKPSPMAGRRGSDPPANSIPAAR